MASQASSSAQAQRQSTQSTATTSQPTQQAQPEPALTRQEQELATDNRTLAEFLLMLDDYEPLIPNEVTDYFLQRVGVECQDPRLKRLLSLAAQKFVSDIAADAFQHARIRTNAVGGRGRAPMGMIRDKTKTVLTMEDLTAALSEHGVNARKPDFYL